jgi:hypothetical protein
MKYRPDLLPIATAIGASGYAVYEVWDTVDRYEGAGSGPLPQSPPLIEPLCPLACQVPEVQAVSERTVEVVD